MKKVFMLIVYLLCVIVHLFLYYCSAMGYILLHVFVPLIIHDNSSSLFFVVNWGGLITNVLSMVGAMIMASVTVFPLWFFPSKSEKRRIKRHFVLSGIFLVLIILPWVFTMIDAAG